MVTCLARVSCHNVLDCASGDVTVMGQSCSERWTVVESVWLFAFRATHLLLEGVDLLPILEDFGFFFWEVGSTRYYINKKDIGH